MQLYAVSFWVVGRRRVKVIFLQWQEPLNVAVVGVWRCSFLLLVLLLLFLLELDRSGFEVPQLFLSSLGIL